MVFKLDLQLLNFIERERERAEEISGKIKQKRSFRALHSDYHTFCASCNLTSSWLGQHSIGLLVLGSLFHPILLGMDKDSSCLKTLKCVQCQFFFRVTNFLNSGGMEFSKKKHLLRPQNTLSFNTVGRMEAVA